MAQWEYKTIKHTFSGWTRTKFNTDELDDELNEYGAQGWELVSSFDTSRYEGASNGSVIIFKRRIE